MAKRRKKVKREADEEEDVDDIYLGDVDESDEEKKAEPGAAKEETNKPRDFFKSLGDGLKAAGETAERYTRIGISTAALEKLKLELKLAYSRLGESVNRCWDAAPDIPVASNDPAIAPQVKAVNDLRRRIRETEIKLRSLKS
jgi:hypothetical protein